MRILRRRFSLGLLALLAAAAQLALAFADTHTHSHGPIAGKLATRAITYGAGAVRSQHPCPPTAPHDDRGNCPICWSVNLASTAILHQLPAPPTPPARFAAPPPLPALPTLAGNESVYFQARAPPTFS
jgi:hypothetical protein